MKFLKPKNVICVLFAFVICVLTLIASKETYIYLTVTRFTLMERLVRAVGTQRIIEARLSGGFAYAPYIAPPTKKKNQSPIEQEHNNLLLSNNELDSADNTKLTQITSNKTVKPSSRGGATSYQNNPLLNINPSTSYFNYLMKDVSTREVLEQANKDIDNTRSALRKTPEFSTIALQIILKTGDTLETGHALGVLYLLYGDYELAINKLEEVDQTYPKNAKVLNDLAAAYLTRAENEDQFYDLIKALSAIDKSIELDTNIKEAHFNRALILEKISLTPAAKQYWSEYLDLDSSSEWAKEVHKHLELLNAPSLTDIWAKEQIKLAALLKQKDKLSAEAIINRFPHLARIYVLNELLPKWVEAYSKENFQQTDELLYITRFIGNKLVTLQNDHLVQDLVITIDRVLQSPLEDNVKKLIAAYQDYFSGKNLFESYENDKAFVFLDRSYKSFIELNSDANQAMIEFELGRYYRNKRNYDKAMSLLAGAGKLAVSRKYTYMLGRIWWNKGIIKGYKYEVSDALTCFYKALNYFETIQDIESIAKIHFQIANTLEKVNDKKSIWYHQQSALAFLKLFGSSYWQINIIIGFGDILVKNKNYKPSLYFYNTAINLAPNNNIFMFTTLLKRSQLYSKLENNSLALLDLKQSQKYLSQINDSTFYKNSLEEISMLEAQYNLSNNPKGSIEKLTNVIKSQNVKGDTLYTVQNYLLRAQAYLAVKDIVSAESDLSSSIAELERQRINITNENQRMTFLEEPQSIYDEMIKFQATQNKPLKAFYYAEMARARVLLDTLDGQRQTIKFGDEVNHTLDSSTRPLTIEEIKKELPKNTTIVEYCLLPNQIIVWIIKNNSINQVGIPIEKDNLQQTIKFFRDSIEIKTKENSFESLSITLYKTIFEPIKQFLSKNEHIVFVSDKDLQTVSFAALIDPSTGRYLIEDYTISLSPSATIFIKCLNRDKQLSNTTESIIAIGNPAFNRLDFPTLGDLPSAKLEAQRVASFYPKSELLIGKDATKENFFSMANNYGIIHFAGHALVDEQAFLNSKLIFAKDKNLENSDLYAYELYNYRFTKTRLIVLAACRTAGGQQLAGEGIVSLAHPFLAAGIPSVIASIWNANDQATEKLFTTFHEERIKGLDNATALRNAQLALIKNPDKYFQPPIMWAPFIVIGSVNGTYSK